MKISFDLKNLLKHRMVDFLILSGIIVYVWYALFPLLQTGYFADDALNVTAPADAELKGLNVFQLTWIIWYTGWFKTMGRLFPLAFYVYSAFAVLKPLIVYKSATLMVILLDIVAFGYFVKLVTDSKYLAYALMLSICTFFQFRIWYEPLLSFHFMMPLVLLEILASLILYHKFIRNNKKSYLAIAVFSYLLALLTYEISYFLCVLHVVVSLFCLSEQKTGFRLRHLWNAVKQAKFFILSTVALVILSAYFRSASIFDKGGAYTITFTPLLFLKTFYIQIIGSFPLSYFFFNRNVFNFTELVRWLQPGDLIIAGGFGYFLYRLTCRIGEKINIRCLLYLGLSLMVLPAVLISLSPKHQVTPLGAAYLQVYLQYFGAELLVAAFLLLIKRSLVSFRKKYLPRLAWLFMVFVVSCVGLINLLCNRYVVDRMDAIGHYQMVVIEKALKNGLLDDIPDSSMILTGSSWAWDRQEYYYWLLGRKFTVKGLETYLSEQFKEMSSKPVTSFQDRILTLDLRGKNVYVMKYFDYSYRDNGYLLFGRLASVSFDRVSGKTVQVNADALKLFSCGRGVFEAVQGEVVVSSTSGDPQISTDYYVIEKLPRMKLGRNFVLFDVPISGETIDFRSLVFSTRNEKLEKMPSRTSGQGGRWVRHGMELRKSAVLYRPGKWITHNDEQYLTSGWSTNEGTHRWSEGRGARIDFKLKSRRADTVMKLIIVPRMVLGPQRVRIFVNKTLVAETVFEKAGKFVAEFNSDILIPHSANSIRFVFPGAKTYKSDSRLMAVALGKVGVFY